jgi:hypothetical protein
VMLNMGHESSFCRVPPRISQPYLIAFGSTLFHLSTSLLPVGID